MAPQRCSKYDVNKDDVELRQSDELLCQVCTSESLRKGKSREDPKEDLKIICVLYENLVDKLKVKKKTANDKPKIRFRWLGSLDLLKDFLTLVLKKAGSWAESRKSSISFKTANLMITFYKNTLTLQLQGSKATEIANFLISLKEIEASTESNKGGIDESCLTVSPDDKTQSDALSVSSGSTSPSYHSSSYSPTGPNITQWSELVSNFQPDTPQLFHQNGDNVNSGLLQQALDQLATFESDLANIRKENTANGYQISPGKKDSILVLKNVRN